MQQLRKDNHYVPKLYLKQWAKDGQVPTYRLLVPSERNPLWKSQSLKGIAFHQHLYTYVVGQKETDEFERWLDCEFEGPAEEAIRRVVQGEQMYPDHWRRLVRFAVALDVRTPARLRVFLQRQNETLPALMDDIVHRSVTRLQRAVSLKEPWACTVTTDAKKQAIRSSALGTLHIRSENDTPVLNAVDYCCKTHAHSQRLIAVPVSWWGRPHEPPLFSA